MTQHCFLPPCAISLEASSPLLAPVSPMPRLAFQLTCSRWAAQWEDTGKGRCVYFLETKCCAAADGSALEQMTAFDTAATQPRHLDRTGLLLVMGNLRKKAKILIIKLVDFSVISSSFRLGEQTSVS